MVSVSKISSVDSVARTNKTAKSAQINFKSAQVEAPVKKKSHKSVWGAIIGGLAGVATVAGIMKGAHRTVTLVESLCVVAMTSIVGSLAGKIADVKSQKVDKA